MTEELTIKVFLHDIVEVSGATGTGRMIFFDGEVDCPNFKGTIMKGGIDTQKVTDTEKSMSARYILEGKDREGQFCRIFIENNGEMDMKGPTVKTTPRIFTDSTALSYLETADLNGVVEPWEKGVMIHIYSA